MDMDNKMVKAWWEAGWKGGGGEWETSAIESTIKKTNRQTKRIKWKDKNKCEKQSLT